MQAHEEGEVGGLDPKQAKARAAEEEEARAAAKRSLGTAVTPQTFAAWRQRFVAETALLQASWGLCVLPETEDFLGILPERQARMVWSCCWFLTILCSSQAVASTPRQVLNPLCILQPTGMICNVIPGSAMLLACWLVFCMPGAWSLQPPSNVAVLTHSAVTCASLRPEVLRMKTTMSAR